MKKKTEEFVTEFKLDPRITSYTFPIIKIIVFVIYFMISINLDEILSNNEFIKLIVFVVQLIIAPRLMFEFVLSFIEIGMLKEKKEKARRTLNDFYNPTSVSLQSITDYIDIFPSGELVIEIDGRIVDLTWGGRSKRFKREYNVFNRFYYIDEEAFYDELGFEDFKKKLRNLAKEEVKVLFHKEHNYDDNCFKDFLKNRDKYEKDTYDGFKDDWRNVL